MRRSRGGNHHSLKRADQQIVGRPLWGISQARTSTVGSVGRSSTGSTRIDSLSPTTSATFTIPAPKSPRQSHLPDLDAVPGVLQNAVAADKTDEDSSSFGGTDTPDNGSTDLGKSEKSEHWADVHVDSVMVKLQNLMNMASEQLEKTGRRASIKDGRRLSSSRLTSHRPSQLGTFCTARPVVAPIREERRGSREGAAPPSQAEYTSGGERRASIESSGSVMCEMLDMVTEDLALLTADLQDLDPNGVIGGLRRQLEEEAANSRAAQDEVSLLRSKLAEMEAENERIRLEALRASKEQRSPIDTSQVRALREELDDLRVQQSELACTQQRNALAFESVCVRTGLVPRLRSNSGSILAPCGTIDEDKALQDTARSRTSDAEKAADDTEKPLPLLSEVVSLGSSVQLPGSLTALNTSTSSCSLTPRKKHAALGAMICPHTLAAALVSPAVAARELRPASAASSALVAPSSCSAPSGGAVVQEGGSLASKYMKLSSPVLNQRSLLRYTASMGAQSTRNSLSSQCSRATSPPRLVQVNVSRSRGSSPCRSIGSPAMPVLTSPPLDFRTTRHESPTPMEATSFFQTASSTTIVPPAVGAKESFSTPQRESTQASVAFRSSPTATPPPTLATNGTSRSGSVAISQGNSVSVAPTLATNAPSRGSSVAISPQLEARTTMRSNSAVLPQPRRWKLKWVLE